MQVQISSTFTTGTLDTSDTQDFLGVNNFYSGVAIVSELAVQDFDNFLDIVKAVSNNIEVIGM